MLASKLVQAAGQHLAGLRSILKRHARSRAQRLCRPDPENVKCISEGFDGYPALVVPYTRDREPGMTDVTRGTVLAAKSAMTLTVIAGSANVPLATSISSALGVKAPQRRL